MVGLLMGRVLLWFLLGSSPAAHAGEPTLDPALRAGLRLRLELDRFALFEDVAVGETGEVWVTLRNTGDVPLHITRMAVAPDPGAPDVSGQFEATTKRGWTLQPDPVQGRFMTYSAAHTTLPIRVRFTPVEPGTARAWLLVEGQPGGVWWAFELVGTTPGEPPPDPRAPLDQLVRVRKGGVRLTRAHAAHQPPLPSAPASTTVAGPSEP